ncbi:MAG: tRNA (N6-isopentenyl adenosine(37)-C2)-methylthiotransferase MiaB [Thermodesulfovibrionales bacterium]
MKKYSIRTFGCQMNKHDSEKMAGILEAGGLAATEDRRDADIIIFNTCSVREKAEQKFLSELGKLKALKRQRPGLKVAVAGCIAQQMGEDLLKRAPHVDYVIGPQNLHLLGDLAEGSAPGPRVATEDNPMLAEVELPAARREKSRAWVSIMYGCDNFCTYCIVPYTRGRERSRPSRSVVEEIKVLASRGCREVTLLGQNVNSYRSDTDFPELLEKIDALEGVERIRFVTSHPRDLSDALVEAMAGLPKVCEHLHLPLQSGSTRVLGMMNRGYTFEKYMERVERLREKVPGIAITTDIIAGFPSETEEDHRQTVMALERIEFDGIFAFRYSPRPGTRATGFEGQLAEDIKLRRLQEILALQDDITLRKNKLLEGTAAEVLVEGPSETDPTRLTGRTRTNKIVNFPSRPGLAEGDTVQVLIVSAMRHSLEGSLVERAGRRLP